MIIVAIALMAASAVLLVYCVWDVLVGHPRNERVKRRLGG